MTYTITLAKEIAGENTTYMVIGWYDNKQKFNNDVNVLLKIFNKQPFTAIKLEKFTIKGHCSAYITIKE